jgi:hypothetical protein
MHDSADDASKQVLDEFLWTVPVANYANAPLGVGASPVTITTPPGVKTLALVTATLAPPAVAEISVQSFDVTMTAAGQPAGNFQLWVPGAQALGTDIRVRTNTSQQINMASATAVGGGFYLITKGWYDNRGK